MSDFNKQLKYGLTGHPTEEATVVAQVTLTVLCDITWDAGEKLTGQKLAQVLFDNAYDHLRNIAKYDRGNRHKQVVGFHVVDAYRSDMNPDAPGAKVQVVPDEKDRASYRQLSDADEELYRRFWSNDDSAAANSQGWDIFYAFGSADGNWQLQRIDAPEGGGDPKFEGDDQAAEFVKAQAGAGDELAKRAIACLVALKSKDVQKFKLV